MARLPSGPVSISQSRSTHSPGSSSVRSVAAMTCGSSHGSHTVTAVEYTDALIFGSGLFQIDARWRIAASAAACRSGSGSSIAAVRISAGRHDGIPSPGIDMLNTHSATSRIDRLESSPAAPSSPVNSNLPWVVQNDMPPSTPAWGVQAANASPARLAPVAVWALRSGDHRARSAALIDTSGFWFCSQEPARVEHPHLAELAATGDGGVHQVPLDAEQDRRAVPVQHAGDGALGGLAGAGRADDRHRRHVTRPAVADLAGGVRPPASPPAFAVRRPPQVLGGHQPPAPRPQHEPARRGRADQQRSQLPAGREAGVGVHTEPTACR